VDERAAQLHRDAIVVDSCAPIGPAIYTTDMLRAVDEMIAEGRPPRTIMAELDQMTRDALIAGDLPGFWEGWEESGVDVVTFTVGAFGEQLFTYENAVRDLAHFARLFETVDRFARVTKAADVRDAKQALRKGVILALQNATHIGDELDNLELFRNLGVRVVQLTYNDRNLLGDGCGELKPAGLSRFGAAAVKRMNELGVLVDTGHCSNPTTMDAIEASRRPIAVTHSLVGSVYAHDRGKSDDVIRAVGDSGGYFGLVVVPFFLTDEPRATLDHFMSHFDRAVELAGAAHVGIGTDWGTELPGPLVKLMNEEILKLGFRPEHGVDWAATVEGFEAWERWPNITRALVGAGYSDDDIRGFLGENFLRVFEAAVG
jgi:membrane dipeptidase